MGEAWLRYAGQTAPAALPGCAGLPRLRRCSIAAEGTAGLGMLRPRAPRPSRGRDAGQSPRPDTLSSSGEHPLRSSPASPCLCRTAANTEAAPPRDRCPGCSRGGTERGERGHRAAPSPGARWGGCSAGLLTGEGTAKPPPHHTKVCPSPVPAALTSARRQPRRSFSAPRPRTQTTPLIAVPASPLRLRTGAAAAAPSWCPTGDVVRSSDLGAHWLPTVNYISLKTPRGPAPFGRAPVPPRSAQPRPAAAAAAWGVWNVRRPPGRPRGGAGGPRHRASSLGRAAAQCNAAQRSAMQRSAVQCNAVPCWAVPYRAVQCSAGRTGPSAEPVPVGRIGVRSVRTAHAEPKGRLGAGEGEGCLGSLPAAGAAAGRCPVRGGGAAAGVADGAGSRGPGVRPSRPARGSQQPVTRCRLCAAPRPGKVRHALIWGLTLAGAAVSTGPCCPGSLCRRPATRFPRSRAWFPCQAPAVPFQLPQTTWRDTAFTAKLCRLKAMEAAAACPRVVVAEGQQSCFPKRVWHRVSSPRLRGVSEGDRHSCVSSHKGL